MHYICIDRASYLDGFVGGQLLIELSADRQYGSYCRIERLVIIFLNIINMFVIKSRFTKQRLVCVKRMNESNARSLQHRRCRGVMQMKTEKF